MLSSFRISLTWILLSSAIAYSQGVTPTIMSPSIVAISQPLSSGSNLDNKDGRKEHDHKRGPGKTATLLSAQPDGALQSISGPLINATGGSDFDGIGANGQAPPDTNFAVGKNPSYSYILETVNSRYAIYTKTGALVVGPNSLSSLWAPLGSGSGCATNNAGDVIAQYDKLADRWIVTQLGGETNPFSECIAISVTADPTGAYYLYSYPYGTILNDYPKFGIWPTATNSAYLGTANLFANGTTFMGSQVCAYDRTKMLVGDPSAQAICFTINNDGNYLPADLDGSTPPLDGTPGYFLTFETLSSLRMYSLYPNFANPASSTLVQTGSDLAVTPFTEACGGGACIPQSGTSQKLDSVGDRLMYRLAFRNFGDHEALVVNHSVNSSGSVAVRWYELRAPVSASATFSVYQQGTFGPDATFRWMGSAAMDAAGDIALGYSVSSSAIHPGIRYTGRTPGDALGTMETESTIISGGGSQNGNLDRWGDYTAMRIDPVDDCTFWYANEYLNSNGSFNWQTHIASFKFASCGGTVATPTFNPPGGTYTGTQQVSISTTTSGASIRYTTDGTNPSETVGLLYSGPVTVSNTATLRAIAYATGLNDSSISSATYTINTAGTGNSAQFVKADTTTQGNWQGTYGADGFNVINNTVQYPSYATVVPTGQLNWTWTNSTSDLRGLQKSSNPSDRIAATWYSSTNFSVDVNITDGNTHQFAFYCVDWDNQSRTERIDVLDAQNGAILDTRTISFFSANPQYLVWNLKGHVTFKITSLAGPNAVLSGLFFGAGGSTGGTTNSVQFVKTDTTTQGNWQTAYGSDGFNVVNDTVQYPSYATVAPSGQLSWTWASSTSDTRGLRKFSNPNDRIAATWYSSTNFSIDINLTDGNTHPIALYFIDWDNQSRSERIDVLDVQSGNVLDTRTISSFSNVPQYLGWSVKGHVIFKVTSLAGPNAVVSGLFFGGAPSSGTTNAAQFVKTDTTTLGNWQAVYGADGFNVINDTVHYPAYATVTPTGQLNWTWASSTSDTRGLQKFSNPGDRIAATWYSGSSFNVDVNVTDGNTHPVALYYVDWDSQGRTERIDVLDAQSGTVLDTRTISSFANSPEYLVWNIQGHVIFKLTSLTGPNAVLSGIFFR